MANMLGFKIVVDKFQSSLDQCLGYDIENSDSEAPVALKIWGI